jgi:DNA (cytosine-5)-methyltransferase 1
MNQLMNNASTLVPESLRICSLFSGIGGFELGLEASGHRTELMCEADPVAREILKTRFSGVELVDDVTHMETLPDCDLLTAGWPCQDLSQAGGTRGLTGERSGLVSHVFRLIDASVRKPQWLLLENVAFALHLQKGSAVTYVLQRLENLGYRWAYRILDTQCFGLPQRRRRLYILASLDGHPEKVLFDGIDRDGPKPDLDAQKIGFYWTEGNRGIGWSLDSIPPLKGGSGLGIPSPPAIWDRSDGSFTAPGLEDTEQLQGFPPGWTEPATRCPKGSRQRWLLVGNAVSVPVTKWIGQRLAFSESCTTSHVDLHVVKNAGLVSAAYGGKDRDSVSVEVRSEGPSTPISVSLSKFGLINPVPLSKRAIGGFARRISASKLAARRNDAFIRDLHRWVRD